MSESSEGASAQFDKPTIPVFSTEDPLLPIVKARLDQDPKKKSELKGLFANDIRSHQSDIISVRSEDLLTFLDYKTRGVIPIYNDNESIQNKSEGYFFTTGNFEHKYFTQHPELHPKVRMPKYADVKFMNVVQHNINIYPEVAAFTAAFVRNVLPVLKPDWKNLGRQLLLDIDEHSEVFREDYSPSLIAEQLIEQFKNQSKYTYKGKFMTEEQFQQLRREPTTFEQLTMLIKEGVDKRKVFEFLEEVSKTRSGIMVGFNEHILQGEIITEANGQTDGKYEIMIKPPNNQIDISNSVVAIESLGEYEDNVLEQLGLI